MSLIYKKIYNREFDLIFSKYLRLLDNCEKWDFNKYGVNKKLNPELYYEFKDIRTPDWFFSLNKFFQGKDDFIVEYFTIHEKASKKAMLKALQVEKAIENFDIDNNYTWNFKL